MSVLLVTKTFAPPWHDSSSGLARVLVTGLKELDAPPIRVLVGATPSGFRGITEERIYGDPGGFAPGIRNNLPVMARLLRRRDERLRHFFFAPNRRSALAARIARRVQPVSALQTLCSLPAQGRPVAPHLFAERNVAVSPWAQARLAAEGVQVCCIEPAVLPLSSTEAGRSRCREQFGKYLLFAGDLRPHGGLHEALAVIEAMPEPMRLVIAARNKTEADAARRKDLVWELGERGLNKRVSLLGRIDWLGDLVAAAQAQLLPATDLTGKMDYPMVLLEGLAAGVPAVIAEEAPMAAVDHPAIERASAQDIRGLVAATKSALRQRGESAIGLYQKRFRPERMAREYLAIYRDMGLVGSES